MRKIEKYTVFINEALDFDDLNTKLKDPYADLKNEIMNNIHETLKEIKKDEEINMIDVEDLISDYISSGKEANLFDKLISDVDLFNFYLKFQSHIDKFLLEIGYLDESPKQHDVYGLYDVVIDGTKNAILEIVKLIQKEIIKK